MAPDNFKIPDGLSWTGSKMIIIIIIIIIFYHISELILWMLIRRYDKKNLSLLIQLKIEKYYISISLTFLG